MVGPPKMSVYFHLFSSQRETRIRAAPPLAIKAREVMIATYLVRNVVSVLGFPAREA